MPSSRTACPSISASPEKARRTYDELGKFLFAKGIPADRIAQIHEPRSSKWRLQAMRFEQAQEHV